MALASPTYPDSIQTPEGSLLTPSLTKESAIRITGNYTPAVNTEYFIRITDLTEGVVMTLQQTLVSGNVDLLSNQQTTNTVCTNVASSGTGLKMRITIVGGAVTGIITETGPSNSGARYKEGDQVRVLGTAFAGGASPANDLVISIATVQNKDLKYEYKTIQNSIDNGWSASQVPTVGFENQLEIGNGLSLSWATFGLYEEGETINFLYTADATSCSSMHVLNTKDGAHLLRYKNGLITAQYNIDKLRPLDQGNPPITMAKTDNHVGVVSREGNTASFSKINSKSVAVGLGGNIDAIPKWVGLQQFKQFKRPFSEDTIIIEDAELKINTEIPQLDDLVFLDTSNWYDSNNNKAGSAGAWTAKFWAGFSYGSPDIFVFRVMTDTFSPRVEKVLEVYRYDVGETGLQNPVAIATDGPHLFVLDKVVGGLLHCFKFTGVIDSSEATCPKIESFDKYNNSFPYALPDTAKGICALSEQAPDTAGAGAWYSDIKITPNDSSMNTNSGGTGRIWIQASWNFIHTRDYAPYMSQEDYQSSTSQHSIDAWEPVISGHGEEAQWLWSVNLSNPAHPNGMLPDLNENGRLQLDNRSPALDKFYKNNHWYGSAESCATLIRGDFDIRVSVSGTQHPQAATVAEYGDSENFISPVSLLANNGLGRKINSKETGVMQTLRFGLVDIEHSTKIGVIALYSPSDTSKLNNATGGAPDFISRPYNHLNDNAALYAEVVSSSAYYASSFVNAGLGASTFDSATLYPLDRNVMQSSGLPKEVEVSVIPASQVPTLNIIDGTVDGFTEKPLIIPLAEDCIAQGYTDVENTDVSSANWSIDMPFTGSRGGRNFIGTSIYKALYSTNSSGKEHLVTFSKDGTIKTYDLSVLYAANSLQTGTGANSWNKKEFLRKNPYDTQNDNILASSAGSSASELVPGGVTTTGNLETATGLIQHPRANGMFFGQTGNDSKKVCFRDAVKYESDLYSSLGLTGSSHSSEQFLAWESAYGGKQGPSGFRIMILPSELPVERQTQIEYNPYSAEEAETKWKFTPSSIYKGINNKLILFNQLRPELSYIQPTALNAGIRKTGTNHGFTPSLPSFTITGFDGDVAVPANNSTPNRATSVAGGGKSDFFGWCNKTLTPNGSTAVASTHLELAGNRDYIYYAFSFVYDGHQESPLSETFGSVTDTDSGWTVQRNGDGLTVKLTMPNVNSLNKRVSHVNFYRSKNKNDPSYAKAFYQLFEQVKLDDSRWTQDSTDANKWSISITDLGKTGETYETRTGVSELLKNTQPHYGISCQGDGYLFVSQAWHQSLDEHSNYVFRSKPAKHNVFDWSTDFLELPEYPTALSYYNGKLFAFSKSATYIINPRTMTIEEDALQSGCLNQDTVVSCDYGMVWADKSSIWHYNGVKIKNIGLPIEIGGDYSYRSRDVDGKVSVSFDSISKCFVVTMKPKKVFQTVTGVTGNTSDLVEISEQSVAWMYHAEKTRWDYWILNNQYDNSEIGYKVLAVCRNYTGGVLYANKNGLYELGTDDASRKSWSWVSKNFVMGFPTLDKRFYKIRAVSQNGTPELEYKVNDSSLGLGVAANEKILTKKGKRIKIKVRAEGETAVDSIGIIYRKPKAK